MDPWGVVSPGYKDGEDSMEYGPAEWVADVVYVRARDEEHALRLGFNRLCRPTKNDDVHADWRRGEFDPSDLEAFRCVCSHGVEWYHWNGQGWVDPPECPECMGEVAERCASCAVCLTPPNPSEE